MSAARPSTLFERARFAVAGGSGAVAGALAFIAMLWAGVFAAIGLFVLVSAAFSPRQVLTLGRVEGAAYAALLLVAPSLAYLLVKRLRAPGRVHPVVVFGATVPIAGFGYSILTMGGMPLPLVGTILVGLQVVYSSILAASLYLILWSWRSAVSVLWRLACGPDRSSAFLTLQFGMIGAGIAAGLATTVAILGGVAVWAVDHDWFYAMAMPAVIGFGLAAPPLRRPSLLFAAAAALLAVSVGWAAIPVLGERHDVHCNAFASGGEHRVFYRAEEPWRWKRPSSLREWLFTPVILAELTFWHVVDPVTETDCPPH